MMRYRYGTLAGFTFWKLDRFIIYVSYFFHAGYGGILCYVLCRQVETYGLQNHGTLTSINITGHPGEVYVAAFSTDQIADRSTLYFPASDVVLIQGRSLGSRGIAVTYH